MSEEQDKRLYAHYKALSEGSYKSSNAVRNELVKSDGARHLADLVKKRPHLIEKPKQEVQEVKEEAKSKVKK